MIKTLPDKYVRKAVYDQIHNIVVDGATVPCYTSRVSGRNTPNAYTLLTTQTNAVNKENKCSDKWESSILIEIFTRYKKAGNTGSKLLADNITDEVRRLTNSLSLDVASDLTVVFQRQDFPNDLVTPTQNEIIYRKFIRIEMTLN